MKKLSFAILSQAVFILSYPCSLQEVIEQMAEAGITAEIAPSVNVKDTAADQEVEKAEDVLVNTVVSGVVEGVFEGQLSPQMLENLAANALGTEVGDAIGNDIDPPQQVTAVPTSSSQQTVPQSNVFERVLHEAEAEVESLVDDIKDLFDPTVVAPNAQKPAASIAKKMSQQGMFARKLTQERETDDGIDLRLNPNAGMGKPDPAQLGKGLNLSDSTSGSSGVSKTPTMSSTSRVMQVLREVNDSSGLQFFDGLVGGAVGVLTAPIMHPVDTLEGLSQVVTANQGMLNTIVLPGAAPFFVPEDFSELTGDVAAMTGFGHQVLNVFQNGNAFQVGNAIGTALGVGIGAFVGDELGDFAFGGSIPRAADDAVSRASNLAHNSVFNEAYKAELRQNMLEPSVKDPMLRAFVKELYKPNATVGSGSTADAVRHELETGQSIKGRFHLIKAKNSLDYLQKWLRYNPAAASGDRAAAENIIYDLHDALGITRRPTPKV